MKKGRLARARSRCRRSRVKHRPAGAGVIPSSRAPPATREGPRCGAWKFRPLEDGPWARGLSGSARGLLSSEAERVRGHGSGTCRSHVREHRPALPACAWRASAAQGRVPGASPCACGLVPCLDPKPCALAFPGRVSPLRLWSVLGRVRSWLLTGGGHGGSSGAGERSAFASGPVRPARS